MGQFLMSEVRLKDSPHRWRCRARREQPTRLSRHSPGDWPRQGKNLALTVIQRLVFCCRTTSASTAPCASRRMCCPAHRVNNCAQCEPLLLFPNGFDLHLSQLFPNGFDLHLSQTVIHVPTSLDRSWLEAPLKKRGFTPASTLHPKL